MTTILQDAEFGEMVIKKIPRNRGIRMHIGTDGRYVVTAPRYVPIAAIRLTINNSRDALRRLGEQIPRPACYREGAQIGKNHRLAVVATQMVEQPIIKTERQRLLVLLPPGRSIENPTTQQAIRDHVRRILRKEAKALLPQRLAQIAQQHGFLYNRVRFSHSGGRWGSCSSTGTISLNIALMKLPDALIDYVLAHELSHTRHMNHSTDFWREVAAIDPHYALHRQLLKRESPVV